MLAKKRRKKNRYKVNYIFSFGFHLTSYLGLKFNLLFVAGNKDISFFTWK